MTSSPATLLTERKNTLLAIVLTCLAYGFYNISDAGVKVLAYKFHFSQIVFVNGVIVVALMSVYGLYTEGGNAFRVHNKKWVAIRACFAAIVGAINILALPHVTLTTFYTLVFTSPFWVALLSAAFLGERLEKRRLMVILSGFCVIGVILRPGGEMFNVWSLAVLFSAFLYSCSMVTLRYLGTRESRTAIICSGSGLSILCALPFLSQHFTPMSLFDCGLFFMTGLVSTIGIMSITFAFQTAPSAAVVAPFHYTQMVWGALLGYFIFGEVPSMVTMVGAAALIAGGLYLIWLETKYPLAKHPYPAAGWFSRLRAYSPSPKERL